MEKKVKLSKEFWEALKNLLIRLLKTKAIEWLGKKLFKNAAVAGFKGWLVKTAVELAWKYLGEPLSEFAIRKGLFIYDKIDGKIKSVKLEEAKKDHDKEDRDRVIDSIFE